VGSASGRQGPEGARACPRSHEQDALLKDTRNTGPRDFDGDAARSLYRAHGDRGPIRPHVVFRAPSKRYVRAKRGLGSISNRAAHWNSSRRSGHATRAAQRKTCSRCARARAPRPRAAAAP
jgi:hypothetical protein